MRDREIRPPLKDWLRDVFAGEPVEFVEEPQTHASRIDLLALTATVHGYEIKGPRDTLDRVDFQMESYALCLSSLTFVAATKHIQKIEERLPKWCGIVEIKGELEIEFVARRSAGMNPTWRAEEMLRMLAPEDIVNWLEGRGEARGFRGKTSYRILVPAVLARVPAAEIPLIVARHLKLRAPQRTRLKKLRQFAA